MPRGVPSKGYRVRGPNKKTLLKIQETATSSVPVFETEETVDQIKKKLNTRFEVLKSMTNSAIEGEVRSLIVSGPPGLGKSFTVEKALEELDEGTYTIVKGYVKPTGLYKLLWKHRHPNNILVFDDADSVFADDIGLNMLKSVTDTTESRHVSWLSETTFEDEDGEAIPSSFVFEGSIIFISNLDFDAQIEKGSKSAPHMQAMISRSYYIDLMMKTRKDYLVRIEQVVESSNMLGYLSYSQRKECLDFIRDNQTKLRELSLRVAIKLGQLIKTKTNWRDIATVTLMRPH